MRKTWISKTLFCSCRTKKKENIEKDMDTLMLMDAENRLNKDFENELIKEIGREECERIAMDEFILL